MSKRFDGKVVLVTGGSSGIGKVAALRFGAEGGRVIVAARREDKSQATVDAIRGAGGEACFIPTDVASHESIRALFSHIRERFGRLDCAFNNAGIAGETRLLTADHTEDNWDQVISIDLKSVFLCMKYEIPLMLQSGGGSIVNNSSIYGLAASTIGHVPYAAAKYGVIGLTTTAAVEYARQNIRVNAVCPGYTHSEAVDSGMQKHPEQFDEILRTVPMGRIAETEEVANVVLWLAGDESSFVTGQAIAPDGGWLAK